MEALDAHLYSVPIAHYLGFIQEIGPYFMEEGKNYTVGDKLVPNPHSWHTVSNLLFL